MNAAQNSKGNFKYMTVYFAVIHILAHQNKYKF